MKKFLISAPLVFVLFVAPAGLENRNIKAELKPTKPPKASNATTEFAQERLERKEEIKLRIEQHQEEVEAKKEQLREEQEQRLQEREEKVASKVAQLQERRKERIRLFFERLTRRLEAAISRLDILIQRIESRLAVLDESGDADTAAIHEQVDEAKSLLLDAQVDLEAATANLDTMLESDDPKAAFEVIRETIKDVKSKLVEVHRILVHVIGDIKGLRVGNTPQLTPGGSPEPSESPEATATPEITAEPTATPEITPTPVSTETASPTATPI
jgi:chromosome segregation ATPase